MNKGYRKWNQKIYFIGMVVMVLVAVIGAIVLSQLRLKENYFFKNYFQYEIMDDQETVSVALYYLTNTGDTNDILQATLVEYPELPCVISLCKKCNDVSLPSILFTIISGRGRSFIYRCKLY